VTSAVGGVERGETRKASELRYIVAKVGKLEIPEKNRSERHAIKRVARNKLERG
jgi:hypothetical protein